MYTTLAYYASPIDGNYYPTYFALPNGQLTPVHFFLDQNGYNLVYFPPVMWGAPPNPTKVNIVINNGFSNIVYYQPQNFGQTQLLYCCGNTPNHITLMCNIEFQRFLPITIGDTVRPQQNTANLPSTPFMEQNPNPVPVQQSSSIPSEITNALRAVQDGKLSNVSINQDQFGFKLTAEDFEGNRILFERHTKNGIKKTSQTIVDNNTNKLSRQQQVKQLRAEKKTQIQIANHLGVSQKTISNDMKELGID
ncbi:MULTISPECIES: transcriptional regulator [unclassified Pseudoalteromonas]|uniref:transcriptional regulator n=1 Tax=unclassified Pseudoalteromonas TaxID=194690 RepID=UPI0005A8D55F|nr:MULTISPECIES: transcriptional regulator [unclassified Pseudoalteromonas]